MKKGEPTGSAFKRKKDDGYIVLGGVNVLCGLSRGRFVVSGGVFGKN